MLESGLSYKTWTLSTRTLIVLPSSITYASMLRSLRPSPADQSGTTTHQVSFSTIT